jgi:hypothetical protein
MTYVDLERHAAGRPYVAVDDVFVKFVPSAYTLKKHGGQNGWMLVVRFSYDLAQTWNVSGGDYVSFKYDDDNIRHWKLALNKEGLKGYKVIKKGKNFLEIQLRWTLFYPNDIDIKGFCPIFHFEGPDLLIDSSAFAYR